MLSMFKKVKCPYCHSTNFTPVDQKRKFAFGKATAGGVVGGIIAGPVGAAIGSMTGINGKTGKTKFVCNNCGHVWEQKV